MDDSETRLPYLTAETPAVPGAIKTFEDDFRVEEIPAYLPCGEGDHTYLLIEKRGMSTIAAVRAVARALGVRPRNVGFAGRKDARGVTRQLISVERLDPSRAAAIDLPGLRVLEAERHGNKLRLGHLRGNRFALRLRETDPGRAGEVRAALAEMSRGGAPNYFGHQRYGTRGDTWEIGRAALHGDFRLAAELIAGDPRPGDAPGALRARELFAAGRLEDAARAWPRGFDDNARVARELARSPRDPRRAVLSLDRRALGLYASAYQSRLFDRVLAARIDELDRIEEGDVAWKHDSGAQFLVEDPRAEQPRADRFEISAAGPLFGRKMKRARGRPAEIEREVLEREEIEADLFPSSGPLRCSGARRPLRMRPREVEVEAGSDGRGEYIELSFALDSGCYATSLLREICKDELEINPLISFPGSSRSADRSERPAGGTRS